MLYHSVSTLEYISIEISEDLSFAGTFNKESQLKEAHYFDAPRTHCPSWSKDLRSFDPVPCQVTIHAETLKFTTETKGHNLNPINLQICRSNFTIH